MRYIGLLYYADEDVLNLKAPPVMWTGWAMDLDEAEHILKIKYPKAIVTWSYGHHEEVSDEVMDRLLYQTWFGAQAEANG